MLIQFDIFKAELIGCVLNYFVINKHSYQRIIYKHKLKEAKMKPSITRSLISPEPSNL